MIQKFENLASAINALSIYTGLMPRCSFGSDVNYGLLTVTVLVDKNDIEAPESAEKIARLSDDFKGYGRVSYQVIECADKKFQILCNFVCTYKNGEEVSESVYLSDKDFDFLGME
jgi:hypothetical protein